MALNESIYQASYIVKITGIITPKHLFREAVELALQLFY